MKTFIAILLLAFTAHGQTMLLTKSSAFRFSPTNISGLKLWLVGNNISGSDGDAVGTWADASGYGFDATQSTAGNKPQLKLNIVNGHKVVRTDGTDDYLSFASNPCAGASAATVFLVLRNVNDPAAAAGTSGAPLADFGTDVSVTRANHWPWTDGNIYDGVFSTARKTVGNPSASLASWALVTIVSAASDYRYYVNGTLVYSTATNTFGAGASPILFWNYLSPGNEYYFLGDVAEIVIYDTALGTGNREAVDNYEGSKYGITITH